jgi:hypothetical protein
MVRFPAAGSRESRAITVTPIPNIGPRGQRQRLRLAVIGLAATAVVASLLFAFSAPPVWRLTCLPPLWMAALGYFQARDKT